MHYNWNKYKALKLDTASVKYTFQLFTKIEKLLLVAKHLRSSQRWIIIKNSIRSSLCQWVVQKCDNQVIIAQYWRWLQRNNKIPLKMYKFVNFYLKKSSLFIFNRVMWSSTRWQSISKIVKVLQPSLHKMKTNSFTYKYLIKQSNTH